MSSQSIYAHSVPGSATELWEPLSDHLVTVGEEAARFADRFGWAQAGRTAGLLHDIGKCSAEFQAYIRRSTAGEPGLRGPNHSTAGAREAVVSYGARLGRMLAYVIAGHHAGLPDAADLDRRLGGEIPPYPGWPTQSGAPPPPASLRSTYAFKPNDHAGFESAFLIRMLFSCLVDADRLETARFYADKAGEPIERGDHADLAVLRDRLRDHMAAKRADVAATAPSALNALRAEILGHAISKAAFPPGLFTLTVPTGGGKTLASLSFALDHAVRHGLRRVVYVIPFTSIIEQTAEVFRTALSEAADRPNYADVLEHHASFDWESAATSRGEAGAGLEPLARLRMAAENWDVPIIVTTAVQFFESLFANRTSPCRKLHNLAGSVIVLDEAQTLPIHLLLPCMAALKELTRNYGASVVLCTATQPALRKEDGFKQGFENVRELAPDPRRLYTALKRVAVEHLLKPIGDEVIAARFAVRGQMLCIVNSRDHARELFDAIRPLPGAVHLTTLMCPRHRRQILAELRLKLKNGAPVRLVATSLIEAGVDIDFPEVWRAAAGLDSIAQAAGRCNREGRADLGRVVVFTPKEKKPPRELEAFWQAARPVLRGHEDPLSLAAIKDYFGELYWQKGEAALDGAKVGDHLGILPAIRERAPGLDFPFKSIADAFRMIEDAMEPVIVPWRADAADRDAETVLGRIAGMDRPRTSDLRRLQQYTVSIPPKAREEWLARGVLHPVHPGLGDALLRFEDLAHYDVDTGVRLSDLNLRLPELNVIS